MEYKDYRKIETEVSETLNNFFADFCNEHTEFLPIRDVYTKKKIHLNGVQFYAGFVCGSKTADWKSYLFIPIMIELIMLWAYKTNRIVDHKQEVWTSEDKVKETVLEHDLLLACILSLLEINKTILGQNYNFLSGIIHMMLSDMVKGFWIEKTSLNIKFLELNKIVKEWAESYLQRNIKFNVLYDFAPLLGYYFATGQDLTKSYIEKIENGLRFSHVGQIINDLSDCIPVYDENVKSYQDQFADIRNGIVTYPVFQLINEKVVKEGLENPNITKDEKWQKDFFELIKYTKTDEKVMDLAKQSYEKHESFWKEVNPKDWLLVSRSYWLLNDNKYFRKFDE